MTLSNVIFNLILYTCLHFALKSNSCCLLLNFMKCYFTLCFRVESFCDTSFPLRLTLFSISFQWGKTNVQISQYTLMFERYTAHWPSTNVKDCVWNNCSSLRADDKFKAAMALPAHRKSVFPSANITFECDLFLTALPVKRPSQLQRNAFMPHIYHLWTLQMCLIDSI